MSLLFAGFKFLVRSCNDSLLHRDLDNAHAKSYKQTGKEINHARKKGKYINGKEVYRNNLKTNIRSANERYSNRDKFISNL